jgi:hypothetical protein
MQPDSHTRPLLNWFLSRGPHTLAFEVSRADSGFQVGIRPCGDNAHVHTQQCDAASGAFQLHASLVAAFRDAGWTSVGYR